jgi:Tfp pilus assembly protein PilF
MRITGALALAIFMAVATADAAPSHFDAAAVRTNNRGVAEMSQQFTERAAASFAEAMKQDPKLAQAAINEGIALMAQQKLDEAKKSLAAAVVQPGPGAARGQRDRFRSHQLSKCGEDRRKRCGLLLFRGRLLSGVEAV